MKEKEIDQWNKWRWYFLLKEVEIKPWPEVITPGKMEKLKQAGLNFYYLPRVDLGTRDDLAKKGVEPYLTDLEKRYPDWKRHDLLDEKKRNNRFWWKNLEDLYWRWVKDGQVDFPSLPGVWLAVSEAHTYPGQTLIEINRTIKEQSRVILGEAGLSNEFEGHLLEAVELNLLLNQLNHENQRKIILPELTATFYHNLENSLALVIGYPGQGEDVGKITPLNPNLKADFVGARLAIVLTS